MPCQCEPCDKEYHQNLEMIDIAVIITAADESKCCTGLLAGGSYTCKQCKKKFELQNLA